MAAQNTAEAGLMYGAYAAAVINRRAALLQRRTMLQGLIATAQDELAEAYRELKTYEITQANREKREQEEENRREQALTDEIGLTLFRRRQNEGAQTKEDGG